MDEAVYKLADLPLMLVDGDAARLHSIRHIGVYDFFMLLDKKLKSMRDAKRNNRLHDKGNRWG